MNFKAILNLVPLAQSTKLLSENTKKNHFVKLGLKNIITTKLIQEEMNLIGGFK